MTQSLEAAARALLAKLKITEANSRPIYECAFVHGVKYTGENYEPEVIALEAALNARPADAEPVDSERVGESDLLGGCLKGFRLLQKMLATAKMPAGVVVTEAWIVEIESAIRQGYVVTQADALAALKELVGNVRLQEVIRFGAKTDAEHVELQRVFAEARRVIGEVK